MVFCWRCGEENKEKDKFRTDCSAVPGRAAVNGKGSGPSTGLPQATSALLSYLGWWVTGLIFYFWESDRFVRFHALQSVFTFGGISLILLLFSALRRVLRLLFIRSGAALWSALLSLLGALTLLIWVGALLLWVVLIVKASQGELFKLPVAGDFAEKQLR